MVSENADMVILEATTVTAKGYEYYPRKDLERLTTEELKNKLYFNEFGSNVWKIIFRRDIWQDIFFPERLIYEDLFIMPHLIKRAQKIIYRCESVYFYNRCNENALSSKKNDFNSFHRYSKFLAYCEHEKVAAELNDEKIKLWSISKALHEIVKAFVIDSGLPRLNDEQKEKMLKYACRNQNNFMLLGLKARILLKSIVKNRFLYKIYGKIKRLIR